MMLAYYVHDDKKEFESRLKMSMQAIISECHRR